MEQCGDIIIIWRRNEGEKERKRGKKGGEKRRKRIIIKDGVVGERNGVD
jgi:hypothetical protein